VLEHLEAAEELQGKVETAKTALAEEAVAVEKEVTETKERFKGDQEALAEARAERADAAKQADPRLLRAYNRVYKKLGKDAVSPMINGRCGACHTTLRPQLQQNLRNNSGLVTCEFCRAILYVEPPAEEGLEDPAPHAVIPRIELYVDEEVEAHFPERFGTKVEVTMRDGRRHNRTLWYARGTPVDACSEDETIQKFHKLAATVMDEKEAKRVEDAVLALGTAANPSALTGALRTASGTRSTA